MPVAGTAQPSKAMDPAAANLVSLIDLIVELLARDMHAENGVAADEKPSQTPVQQTEAA